MQDTQEKGCDYMKTTKSAWQTFTHWFTISVGSIGILLALFCILTQWNVINVSTKGISVQEVYQGPNEIIIYRLNVPEGRYASCWEWEYQDNGAGYQIPKRSIIELSKNNNDVETNRLMPYLLYDCGETNSAQEKRGGPEITSWYIGSPNNAVLIWSEGMQIEPAPFSVLKSCGFAAVKNDEWTSVEGEPKPAITKDVLHADNHQFTAEVVKYGNDALCVKVTDIGDSTLSINNELYVSVADGYDCYPIGCSVEVVYSGNVTVYDDGTSGPDKTISVSRVQ